MNYNQILKQQKDYYIARANEYDEWFLRKGRYDRGKKLNALWFSEVQELKQKLKQFNPKGQVMEIACGTGWWTQELVKYADHITAVDAVKEVLAICKKKIKVKKVTYIQKDIFSLKLQKKFDVVFFSFWVSHVPPGLFESFWQLVHSWLKPDGRVFFIDNLKSSTHVTDYSSTTDLRKVKSGEEFLINKIFYKPEELDNRLKMLGWKIAVKHTPNYFLYGFGRYHRFGIE